MWHQHLNIAYWFQVCLPFPEMFLCGVVELHDVCCQVAVLEHGMLYCCRSLDSEVGVGYWTDYLKTFLHPRSLYQLPGVWQGQGRFGAFGDGKGLFGVSEMRDDVMDRVRYWAEECDAFQVGTAMLT